MILGNLGQVMSDDIAKAAASSGFKEDGKVITIESKYGPIDVNLEQSVLFPYGLLGMSANTDFIITNFPSPNMDQFKLLQNLNDHSLSFAVLPVSIKSDMFEQSDIEEACNVTEIKKSDLLILAIISVQRTAEEVRVTANMRAPLMVDSGRRMGVQYVFPSNKYEIRHVLSRTKNN